MGTSTNFNQVGYDVAPKQVRRICLVLCTILVLAGCQTATPSIEPRPAGMPVKLGIVRSIQSDDSSTYLASLRSRRSVPLRPQVSAEVRVINVRSGDKVSAGQVLMELDDTKQQAIVRGLQASEESLQDDRSNIQQTLLSLQASRESRVARVDFAQQQVNRYSDLLRQGAVSKENVDEKDQILRVAHSELLTIDSQIQAQQALVAKNQKQIKQCQAQIKEQQTQLQYFVIRAPSAGVVGDVPVRLGELVTSSTLLTTLEEAGPLEVYISVPADQSDRLRIGLPVRLVNEENALLAAGKIFYVSQTVNDADQSILAKAIFENSDNKLRTGQMVNVQVIWSRGTSVLVPVNAVVHLSGKDFVFIAETTRSGVVARQRLVDLGDIVGEDYKVKSGLKPNEQIVLSGVQNLVDGAPLNPK